MSLLLAYTDTERYSVALLSSRATVHETLAGYISLSRHQRRAHASAALRLRLIAAVIEAGR